MNRFKKLTKDEKFNLSDKQVRGHLIFRDAETGKVLHEQDNLVLMRTRVFLFEHLFGVDPPQEYECARKQYSSENRHICLFKVGSGGADVNANAFNPYTPKFSDKDLSQPVPFVIRNIDKDEEVSFQDNVSVYTELTDEMKNLYYLPSTRPDGSIYYYGKKFNETGSKGWMIDQSTGEIAYSLSMTITEAECRGYMINEIGVILAEYDEENNTYIDPELATRITFDTESLKNASKAIEIEYIFYI